MEQRLEKLEADVAEFRQQSAGEKKKEWLSLVSNRSKNLAADPGTRFS